MYSLSSADIEWYVVGEFASLVNNIAFAAVNVYVESRLYPHFCLDVVSCFVSVRTVIGLRNIKFLSRILERIEILGE
jgi:hypothetical protein